MPAYKRLNMSQDDITEITDEYYDAKWYHILDRLALSWIDKGRKKKTTDELEYKLGLFRTHKGRTEYAALLRNTHGI